MLYIKHIPSPSVNTHLVHGPNDHKALLISPVGLAFRCKFLMQQAPVGCLGRPAYNYEMIIIELLVRSGVELVKYSWTGLKQL